MGEPMDEKIAKMNRVRNTTATRRRAVNMRSLIEQLRAGPMDTYAVSSFLSYSVSGARKYLNDMLNCGVLIGEAQENDLYLYRLSEDESKIAEFEQSLETFLKPKTLPPEERASPRNQLANSGRNIHVMTDDVTFRVSVNRNAGEGQRDPLVAALFGAAKAPATPTA